MGKFILILALAGILLYFIARRFRLLTDTFQLSKPDPIGRNKIELVLPASLLRKCARKILVTVVSGIVLLLVILVITIKFKIALIMLPLSFYLIGQFFIFNNHVQSIKAQSLLYDHTTSDLIVNKKDGKSFVFNLIDDVKSIREIKSVQSNNGMLLGYYELSLENSKFYIPFLLRENPATKSFFDKMQYFPREVETKLFPVI